MTTVLRGSAGIVLGAGLGALSSLTNAAVSPVGVAASLIVNAGWAWAGVAVAAGALIGKRVLGAVAGVLALIAMTTAYYGTDSVLRHEAFAMYWPEMRVWWLAALIFGSALGVVGASIGRPGAVGLLAGLTVPVGAAVEMLWLPRWSGARTVPQGLDEVRLVVLVAAAVGAGVVVRAYLRRPVPVPPRRT
jgi:hypothetical protein